MPPLEKETPLTKKQIEKEQKFTQPPSRYTEASLVKELEEQGIGRPSTYAPTMSVIQDRGYILKEQKKLYPSDLGFVVNDQMSEYFNTVVDLSFTASMEKQLDEVSDGKHEWQKVVDSYYKPLDNMIQNAYTNMEKVNFGERVLGTDPESGKEVLAREGRFGPMIQIGRGSESEEKPRFAGLLPDQDIETITLEDALKLFQLPRTIGTFENVELLVNSGRYGPYIKFDSQFVSIPREINPLEISLEQAVELIKEKRKKDAEKYIHVFDEHDPPVMVLNGRYGPYITSAKKNYKIPKDIDPKTLDLAQCLDIINTTPKRKK